MTLDVIIPYYKAQDTIFRALDSIIHQEDDHNFLHSIFIIFDGDYDESKDTALEIFKRYPDNLLIPILLPTNRGVGNARQTGINLSTANYFMFVDADDYLASNCFNRIYEKLEKNHWPNCYSANFYNLKQNSDYSITTNDNTTWFHGRVYKKEALTVYGLSIPNLRMNEDGGFNMAFFEVTRRVVRDDLPIYYRTYNECSLSRSGNNHKFKDFFHSVFEGMIMIEKSNSDWYTVNVLPGIINQLFHFLDETKNDQPVYDDSIYYFRALLQLVNIDNLLHYDSFVTKLRNFYDDDKRDSSAANFDDFIAKLLNLAT